MRITKNVLRLKEAVRAIIDEDESLETKLNTLTSIGIETSSEDLFFACEDVRNDLDDERIADDIW